MKAAAVAGLALLLGLGVVPAQAGHGLMNAFSDIAWLPDPGRTPDQADYALDALAVLAVRFQPAPMGGQERGDGGFAIRFHRVCRSTSRSRL